MGRPFNLPIPPQNQALSSKTFKPPPLDGSLTLTEIYDWNAEHAPEHPLFVFSDTDGTLRTIYWPEAVRAMHRAGQLIQSRLLPEENHKGSIIAILASADTITFYTFIIGIIRAGFIVFPISPRNSASAVAHLLTKTNATHLLVGHEEALQSLANTALESLSKKPRFTTMPCFEDVYDSSEPFTPIPRLDQNMNETAIILHSSGSTAYPKPIYWKHSFLIQISLSPFFGERDLTGKIIACHAIPMYHAMGFLQIAWVASAGVTISSFKPQVPAVTPTSDAVMKGAMATKSDIIFSVPSFVEQWSRDPAYVAHLQSIDAIFFGGAPLNRAVGDLLYHKGIMMFILYGSTECGAYSLILPKTIDKDWDYFCMSKQLDAAYIPDGKGNVEFVTKRNAYLTPCIINTKVDGVDAYAIGDVLTPHPTKPGFYRFYGRTDDQIVHSTGEKTNPGPLENILNQDPLVQAAVMFGQGKFHAGVVIDPKPDFKFDPSNVEDLISFRQKIWASVEKLNNYAPQHSRVFKEMILVSKPSKPFTYTAKLMARRQAIINDYAPEIEEAYASVEESTQPDILPPSSWEMQNALPFVRRITLNVMQRPVADDDDIFQHGCDSLQATWIRNTLLNALRRTDVETRRIPMNFVYDHPTIRVLSAYVCELAGQGCERRGTTASSALKIDEMRAMVEKYSANLPQHRPRVDAASAGENGDIVLLTGTTGGLGAALLEKLLSCSEVSIVYALNRKSSNDLRSRQESAFRERGMDLSLLDSPKLILLESDLNASQFGLTESLVEEIRRSVTHIVHIAYTVNFNLALSTFEKNVSGLRNLIDLSLASPRKYPPKIIFTSSVGVVRNHIGHSKIEEALVEPVLAVGSGYSESKWVCEQILAKASLETSLKYVIIRVDQLSGMSTNGFWNVKDWVPALFTSSVHVGCLPDDEGVVSWIPIDVAAQAILEMRNAEAQVLHVSHPSPVKWTAIAKHASQLLSIKLVPSNEWVLKVDAESGANASAEEAVLLESKNPALRLRDFFRHIAWTDLASPSSGLSNGDATATSTALGTKLLSMKKSRAASRTLEKDCRPIEFSDVKKWLLCLGLVAH